MLCESSCNAVTRFESGVLILVLMEDALREDNQTPEQSPEKGLNPCSNGRCSARFNNQYSLNDFKAVLILVLMEDALREIVQPLNNESLWVLILVLMEDALREVKRRSKDLSSRGLNPCSNGRCSASS